MIPKSKSKIQKKKKLASLLVKKKICEAYLLIRKTALIQGNFAKLDTQPIIKVKINNIDFSSTLDTGSSYTILQRNIFNNYKYQLAN